MTLRLQPLRKPKLIERINTVVWHSCSTMTQHSVKFPRLLAVFCNHFQWRNFPGTFKPFESSGCRASIWQKKNRYVLRKLNSFLHGSTFFANVSKALGPDEISSTTSSKFRYFSTSISLCFAFLYLLPDKLLSLNNLTSELASLYLITAVKVVPRIFFLTQLHIHKKYA